MLTSDESIRFLIQNIDTDDSMTSSHWKKYHKDFKIDSDLVLSGLSGFGGNSSEYSGISKFIHRILQKKYRILGNIYDEFPRIDSLASDMTHTQSRAYDLDVLRQTLTLSFLIQSLPSLNKNSTVAVIGDGFASLSLLLLLSQFAKKVVLVNLAKTLLVDCLFFQKYNKIKSVGSLSLLKDNENNFNSITSNLICVQASNHEYLRSMPIDLFINIASMQEMNPDIISAYFSDIQSVAQSRDIYFYCCNRINKSLPDGTITKFFEYPWSRKDQILTDELCPWHQQYYSLFPPFYHPYDGPIQHRLVKISGES